MLVSRLGCRSQFLFRSLVLGQKKGRRFQRSVALVVEVDWWEADTCCAGWFQISLLSCSFPDWAWEVVLRVESVFLLDCGGRSSRVYRLRSGLDPLV